MALPSLVRKRHACHQVWRFYFGYLWQHVTIGKADENRSCPLLPQ